jgi:hypothetical protein
VLVSEPARKTGPPYSGEHKLYPSVNRLSLHHAAGAAVRSFALIGKVILAQIELNVNCFSESQEHSNLHNQTN